MTTKLEAVNKCLDGIGESPVSSLASGLADAETAERIVNETTKDVLSVGWHSNTDYEVTLVPDSSGYIHVPGTALRIDTSKYSRTTNVVARIDPNDNARKLFKVKDQTYVFTASVTVDIVHSFDFEDLTHELQRYIAAKSARKFQKITTASATLDKMLQEEEALALAALQDSEAESEDLNILDGAHCQFISRRNRYWGY
jgi:hypothetical protein